MNEQNRTSPSPRLPRQFEREDTVVGKRQPLLGLLLNDLNEATIATMELAGQMEKKLSDISRCEDSGPQAPCDPEPPLAPALEMLRTMLRRVNATNERLGSTHQRVEI